MPPVPSKESATEPLLRFLEPLFQITASAWPLLINKRLFDFTGNAGHSSIQLVQPSLSNY